MKFIGQETFSQDQVEIWDRISNLEFMASIIPDLDRVEQVDSDQLVCRVKPRFAFLTGSMQLTFIILQREPPNHLKAAVQGKKIGAGLSLQIEISLSGNNSSTCLSWESEIVERTGLLKPVGNSLIQGAAEKVIANMWNDFREAITG